MGSYREEIEKEERFFDSREDISSVSDSGSNRYDRCGSSVEIDNNFSQYEVWFKTPESVHDRRNSFLEWMDSTVDLQESAVQSLSKIQLGIDRMVESSGAVLRTSSSEDGPLSTQSQMPSHSIGTQESPENGKMEDTSMCKITNLDNGTEFVVDELDQNGMLSGLREVGSNKLLSFEEFQRTNGSSPLVQRLMNKYASNARVMMEAKKKAKRSWLRRLGRLSYAAPISDRHRAAALSHSDYESIAGPEMQRVKVHTSRKRSKELSSLYAGQEFLAHNGSILTMKFSHDGHYLASGGEDGVVRVWRVIEDNRLDQFHMPADDPSFLYFTMNHDSKIASLRDKVKVDKPKRRISSDSTCVIFPPKVFKVLEKPLHEFQGHKGEVLDLSWSKKRFLLSSSVDRTVRLWQVGRDRCLRVFSHNNYVTCVDFNPADDNYFISGSIDGKVRIWEVLGWQVVDYTVIREIVTAVCYRPDGKGGIVGTLSGNCLFYDMIDNCLQLDAQISLQGKKKLIGKRITGFEFSPSDPTKVVVTCADSVVRVLSGMDIIYKFRASSIGIAANQMSASFTADGKHVVSTSEDSHIYVWNCNSQEKTSSRGANIQSCESFMSQNVSVAIPWPGIENGLGSRGIIGKHGHGHHKFFGEMDQKTRGFLLDSLGRGSATWPEEQLNDAISVTKSKSELKFLKNACQNIFSSPHLWGLVIVTAGWDGKIRTYPNYGL